MPLQATSGAASYDGFGGGVPFEPTYIEQVFATHLYTGNQTSQTITNGIDLSTKGGLVWIKTRSSNNHVLTDTARGITSLLNTNNSNAQQTVVSGDSVTAFNTNGFSLGIDRDVANPVNTNGVNFASWTFRKQPKFFDVVTFTVSGGVATFNHSLGSVPGFIMIKDTVSSGNWICYHRSATASNQYIAINSSAAVATVGYTIWTSITSTSVSINGAFFDNQHVAYLFAHDAGGFGLTGTDNVISCGSYTGNGSATGPTITLGYEPQWLLVKRAVGGTSSWNLYDTMRGMPVSGATFALQANLSGTEYTGPNQFVAPSATGFYITSASSDVNTNGDTYIYIAIRRGPMKTPTTGTSVLNMQTYTGTQVARTITTANTVDLSFTKSTDVGGTRWNWTDRLRGATRTLDSSLTAAEASDTTGYTSFAVQKGYTLGTGDTYDVNTSGRNYISWNFTRYPGFFDVVCYTGTGSATTQAHNLGVVPEMMIVKARSSSTYNWQVYHTATGNSQATCINLNIAAYSTTTQWDATTPTASVFSVGASGATNVSGVTYVAYLFATVTGVSKVGSYTGTGTTLQIDCGFTGGARFVLIKRTDSTGDWYCWDSSRGIVAGNDPYLLLNSTAAEVTNTDYVDTYSAGFEISSTAPAAINANGGTYIFLAIA
jgi:hypothetical protein